MWIDSVQTRLLLQEFSTRVVPYRQRHDPDSYVLSTDGAPRYKVGRALSLGIQDGIDGFLRAAATRLLTAHEVWFEVSFEKEREEVAPFAISEVAGVRRTRDGNLVQQVPNSEELPEWHRDDGDWGVALELDTDRMIHATLPDTYPSEVLLQVVADLAEIEFGLIPAWVMEQSAESRQQGPAYDATEAARTRQLRLAQAALPIGWTARELFLGEHRAVTDYYHYLRELRFLHFRSSLRSCAEDALRQVLRLAGDQCGFRASVTAFGIHTPDEVKAAIQRFEAGDLPFAAVNDILYEAAKDTPVEQRTVL